MRLLFSFKSTTEVFNMQGVWHLLYSVTHYDSPSGFSYYNWTTKMRGEPLPTTWERNVQLCEFNHGNCYQSLVLQCNTFYKQKKILTMKYREMAWMWSPRIRFCVFRFPPLCLMSDLSFRLDIPFDFATFRCYHISILLFFISFPSLLFVSFPLQVLFLDSIRFDASLRLWQNTDWESSMMFCTAEIQDDHVIYFIKWDYIHSLHYILKHSSKYENKL